MVKASTTMAFVIVSFGKFSEPVIARLVEVWFVTLALETLTLLLVKLVMLALVEVWLVTVPLVAVKLVKTVLVVKVMAPLLKAMSGVPVTELLPL